MLEGGVFVRIAPASEDVKDSDEAIDAAGCGLEDN